MQHIGIIMMQSNVLKKAFIIFQIAKFSYSAITYFLIDSSESNKNSGCLFMIYSLKVTVNDCCNYSAWQQVISYNSL